MTVTSDQYDVEYDRGTFGPAHLITPCHTHHDDGIDEMLALSKPHDLPIPNEGVEMVIHVLQ